MSTREKDDGYSKVVVVLNADYRVIECVDGMQWIIQRRHPSQWESKRYHRERKTLIPAVERLCGKCKEVAMAILFALPDWTHQKSSEVKHTAKESNVADPATTISASTRSVYAGKELTR